VQIEWKNLLKSKKKPFSMQPIYILDGGGDEKQGFFLEWH